MTTPDPFTPYNLREQLDMVVAREKDILAALNDHPITAEVTRLNNTERHVLHLELDLLTARESSLRIALVIEDAAYEVVQAVKRVSL